MVVKKFLKSAINWSELAKMVPEHQKSQFVAFKSKSDAYLRKVQSLPDTLPKLDWNYYKANIGIPGMVESFQRRYEEMKIPYPEDKATREIDAHEEEIRQDIVKFKAKSNARIAEYKRRLEYLASLIPYEEMTLDDFKDAFPEDALDPINKPTFWPHNREEQIGYEEWLELKREEKEEAELEEEEKVWEEEAAAYKIWKKSEEKKEEKDDKEKKPKK